MDRLRDTDLGRRIEGRVFLSVHEAFVFAQRTVGGPPGRSEGGSPGSV